MDEKIEATAVFEIKQEVALYFKEKADEGGIFKKKKIVQYQEKQAEADAAKSRIDDIQKAYDALEIEKRSAVDAYKKNENEYFNQLKEFQTQLDKEKDELNKIQENYNYAKRQYDDAIKRVVSRENELNEIKKEIALLEKEIKKNEEEIVKLENKEINDGK